MPDPKYQPYYCEENIWHLIDDYEEKAGHLKAVVVSNEERGVATWSQAAAPAADRAVVWDYHVVLLGHLEGRWQIMDLDCRVGRQLEFDDWWRASFPFGQEVPMRFRPEFRVVDASVYRETLSSDRSHMYDEEDDQWHAPPPPWEPIFDEEQGMNLPDFIDMEAEFVGRVLAMTEFRQRFQSPAREPAE